MNLETSAYTLLAIAAVAWTALAVLEVEWATRDALLTAVTVLGFGLLLVKALRDRWTSAEDDHYSRNVEK